MGEFITIATIIIAMYFCEMKNGERGRKDINNSIVRGKYFY